MHPLASKDSARLREYLNQHELDAFLMLSHLDAQGVGPVPGKARAGEYYWLEEAVLALYPDGTAFAYMPGGRAPAEFARLLSRRRVTRLYATPLEAAMDLDAMVTGKAYHYALTEKAGIQSASPRIAWPEGFRLKKLALDDERGFEELTRIFNAAQDEHATARAYRVMAGAMTAPEGIYLGEYRDVPCLTMAAEARTPHYLHIGSAGVLEQMRGRGFAQAALSRLCEEAARYGLTGFNLVAEDNYPSQRVMEKCGYRFIEHKRWLLVWYEA